MVNERFTIIDETRDCRKLFAELEQSLDASWELMYREAEKYRGEHGDLLVPARYRTESGLPLGSWLNLQRKIFAGKADGFLSSGQVERLSALGIVWDRYSDLTFEQNYLRAKAYREQHGDLLVPARYVCEDGFPLGLWISRMRSAKANGRSSVLTREREAKLNALGMSWDAVSSQWERNYLEAAAYYRCHGNLRVPMRYVTESGLKLGNWITHLRAAKKGRGKGRLTKEQEERLELIGMEWELKPGRKKEEQKLAS